MYWSSGDHSTEEVIGCTCTRRLGEEEWWQLHRGVDLRSKCSPETINTWGYLLQKLISALSMDSATHDTWLYQSLATALEYGSAIYDITFSVWDDWFDLQSLLLLIASLIFRIEYSWAFGTILRPNSWLFTHSDCHGYMQALCMCRVGASKRKCVQ